MTLKLFIGPSAESLFIAKELEARLQADFDVKVWDRAFETNEYFLERLQKELFLTDFALFVIAPDDKISKRGRKAFATRDNVVFELGMFIGALGLKRAHFVTVDAVRNGVSIPLKLPSDLDGIKKSRLRISINTEGTLLPDAENEAAFAATAAVLRDSLLRRQSGVSLLPSTPLAIGYYRNFILQACKELSGRKDFAVDGVLYDLTQDIFDFYIVIPDNGSDSSHEAYSRFVRKNALKQIEVQAVDSPRTFPFFIRSDVHNGRVQLYDLPTTLRASRETVRLVMPPGTSAEEIQQLELKDILNFRNTILHLLKEPESANFRDNIHVLAASELS